MQTSLLTTKLYFPNARPSLVPRPRLVERLQAGIHGLLTLISAPAGSGKTTLLSEWRTGPGRDVPVAWLSLEADDNDPLRFFQYLVAALDLVRPGIADEAAPLLQPSEQLNGEAILTLLVNALGAFPQEFVLVLDDYHVIETPAIHTALTFLLDHPPPHMHIVLLTRADPALPLARLRARGQLTEIRAEHLRFTKEKAAAFLNQVMGLNLTDEELAALEKRTEGWIAGLQLAALSMQGRTDIDGFVAAFTGSNQYIVDYLAEEVLSRQPEEVHEFLLVTSILERLTGPLCDALTGEENGRKVLAGLDHSNLFVVPLDNDQTWFRYHHLFADFLRSRLLHAHPKIIGQLHAKASEWFEVNGFQDEAINHALEAKDFERTARLYSRNQLEIIYTRNISALDKWIKIFPDDYLWTNPWLCIAKAHILWVSGRRDEIGVYVTHTEDALTEWVAKSRLSVTDNDYCILRGDTYAFQALIALRKLQFDLALELAQKAAQIIPRTARACVFALGVLYTIYHSLGDINRSADVCKETIAAARRLDYSSMDTSTAYVLANLLRVQGHLRQALRVLQESLKYVEDHGQARLFYSGILHIGLAATYYEWNTLDEMGSELETGLALCRMGGMSILVLYGMLSRAMLCHARGDLSGAFEKLEEIEHECRENTPGLYQAICLLYRLRWQASQGDCTGLNEWISQIDLNVEKQIGTDRFDQLLAASGFLFALGKPEEALPILIKVEEVARKRRYLGWLIPILVLEAVIWQTKDEPRALEILEQALELAEPEGYIRVFLDQGERMRELLYLLQKSGQGSEYVNQLLAAFNPRQVESRAAIAKPELLSKREIELLNLIAVGCSNKEIATRLVIEVTTVKRHTTNIFNKLDAKNRTEAVARARELNLL